MEPQPRRQRFLYQPRNTVTHVQHWRGQKVNKNSTHNGYAIFLSFTHIRKHSYICIYVCMYISMYVYVCVIVLYMYICAWLCVCLLFLIGFMMSLSQSDVDCIRRKLQECEAKSNRKNKKRRVSGLTSHRTQSGSGNGSACSHRFFFPPRQRQKYPGYRG